MEQTLFNNTRTGAKSAELRAYATESESDAKRRLEAAGWSFQGVDYAFENSIFKVNKEPTMGAEDSDGDKDE
jgi:hypothetical protein